MCKRWDTPRQLHRCIATVLEERFPATAQVEPEVLGHHYTEAGCPARALPYWQRAGQRSIERAAHVEAIVHLHRGLDLMATLPDTTERAQQELALQMTLGPALIVTKGDGAPEVEEVYTRVRALCEQVGDTPQRFSVLFGLWGVHNIRAQHRTARELGMQCLTLAQRMQQSAPLLRAHSILGTTLFALGELLPAQDHLQQGLALYDPQQWHLPSVLQDPGMLCEAYMALTLWLRGYADQAAMKFREVLTMARSVTHPLRAFSQVMVMTHAAAFHQFCREWRRVRDLAEAVIPLSAEQSFAYYTAAGTMLRGWTLVQEGRGEEGIAELQRGLAAYRATGADLHRPYFLTLLAESYLSTRQYDAGLATLDEALPLVTHTGEHWWEAELYRLKGELLFQQATSAEDEAEGHMRRAFDTAHQQGAKTLELRAAVSLSRLWQQQGKRQEARDLLAPVYGWFTEGFDTADLQEAKALLEELS